MSLVIAYFNISYSDSHEVNQMLKKFLGVTVYKLNRFKFDGLTHPPVFEW